MRLWLIFNKAIVQSAQTVVFETGLMIHQLGHGTVH